jgi:hypothetical protein
MWSWLLLGALVVLFWYWFDSLRAHEIATAVCLEMCRRHQVQLLDSTITLQRTRLYREAFRPLQIERYYTFDFSVSGAERTQGQILMRGQRMVWFELPGHGGATISPV